MKKFLLSFLMLALLVGSAWAATDQSGDRNVFSRIPDGRGYTQVAAKAAPMGVATAWVDDDYTNATTGWGVDHFATINGAVQAINAGGTINVYPGSYIEAAPSSYLYDGTGPYTFGLFLAADGVTVQGVDASGTPVTSYAGILADVQCNSTSNFGPSGVFIQGSNVTVSGLNIFLDPAGLQNKTIEVIGDAATVKYCHLSDGNSLYINDFRFDVGTNTSWVKSYTVLGNWFTYGTSVDIASGGGFSGPTAGRQILDNTFEMDGATWNAISFNGSGTGVEWFVYSVGGAVITGNSFTGGNGQYIRARGDYDNSQFDWGSYFANNTFDHAVVAGADPSVDLREYLYTSGSHVFNHCRRIGTSIQAEIGTAAAGDIVKVAAGTYNEGLSIGKSLTILGPNASLSPNTGTPVAPAVLAPLGNTHAIQGTAAGVSVTIKGLNFDLTGANNDYRFVQLINQASNTWTFEHNVFANARECVNGNWYLTGTLGDLYFNLLDNLFTGSIVSNGIALWGTGVHHVDIRDNVFRDNQGWALNVNNVHGAISNNLFADTALTGPNWYDDQSGMIVASANNNLVLSGNTFSNLGAIGVSIYDGFDGVLTGTNNTFTGCATAGVRVRPGALDLSGVSFSGNSFSGNAQAALNSTALVLNARNNWWGSASGPYHTVANPFGTGDAVSDFVDFAAWTGTATASATPATSGPINCGQSVVITFGYTPDAMSPPMFGYNAVVKASPEVSFGTIANLLPFGAVNSYWYTVDEGVGVDGFHRWNISGITLATGGQTVTAPADLFSIQFLPVSNGTATIAVESLVFRDASNGPIPSNLPTASILIDCTAPAAVTGITAAPGHNKVVVGWTHTGLDVANYVVYRGVWDNGADGVSAYPEYDDLAGDRIPARPATRAAAAASANWAYAGTVPAGTTTFTDQWADANSRGVYYYEVFAVDAANNPSPAAAANKRATNYWLGDVDGTAGNMVPNGLVNVYDMTVLGTWFGTASVALNSAASPVDVGPTDNYSRVGIPTTDSKINFEDLMVFAMNFGVVSAAKSEAAVGTSVDLAWVRYDDGSMALRLVDGNGLKGVRVTANVPVGKLIAGRLLDEQSELTFAQNVGENLDANVAVMGVGTTFTGTGDLFVIPAGAAIEAGDLAITARAIDNSTMTVKLTNAAGGQAAPRVFALNANCPNPFNPMTKISFSLPEAQKVRLTVYGLDGRKVATLLDETCGSGLHEIVWTGRDDAGQAVASGTYFYRVDAGPYSSVRKMTLMK